MPDAVKPRGVVVSGNNTLWRGNVLAEVVKAHIDNEFGRFHLFRAVRGMDVCKEVEFLERTKGGVTGQMEGQRLLYEFLISKGLATKDTMFRHAKDYIERNMDRTVSDFVYKMLQMGVPVFFADEGGSTSASYAIKRLALMEIEKLGKVVAMSDRIMSSDSMAFFMEGHGEMLHLGKLVLTDGVFNKEVFDDRNVLVRVKRTISSAEEKLARVKEMLEAHNLALGDVVAICGNPSDGLVLREAGTALIPPSATWEIKDKDIKGAKRMAA